METFVFNPKVGRETLASFNDRILDFARDEVVVGVAASVAGGSLVLGLTTASDIQAVRDTPCVFPSVFMIEDTEDPELEEKINEFVEAVNGVKFDGGGDTDLQTVHQEVLRIDGDKAFFVATVIYGSVLDPDEE